MELTGAAVGTGALPTPMGCSRSEPWGNIDTMPPRVLIVLDAASAWSRGVLMGFAGVANQRDWTVLHYHPTTDLAWLLREWEPKIVVLPPWQDRTLPPEARTKVLISVNDDRSAEGIASVCLDESKIGTVAASHLLATGLGDFATFRFDSSPFGIARERAFGDKIAAAGPRLAQGWQNDGDNPQQRGENAAELVRWLKWLPKPCGVFACTDSWARVIARYCQVSGIKIPEHIAVLGVDNDVIDCEFSSPALSSVAIPWRLMGQRAAEFVEYALAGKSIRGKRVIVEPLDVVVRRSSEVLAVSEPLVRKAIEWIERNASQRITVPDVAKALGTTRQTLERRFRAVLGRTVMLEVRRAHVQVAKRHLATTHVELSEVARLSGFTSAALLSVAFGREVGMPPGAYRKQLLHLYRDGD
jgi:LacI family transcriptional regulator